MPAPSARKNDARQAAASASCDLEEIRPRLFLIRNPAVRRFLKGEGSITGMQFELTSWRREGLLARLAAQGFHTRTLAEQVEQLPALPAAEPVGDALPRLARRNERYSYFDPQHRDWQPAPPLDKSSDSSHPAGVLLRTGWVIRRRRGRGPASYYRVFREGSDSAGIAPIDETDALLMGFAQSAAQSRPPVRVPHDEQHYWLPALPLPAPHRELLQRCAVLLPEHGWQLDKRDWPLVRGIYERLHIPLRVIRSRPGC
jgi:hypothetical protein